MQTFSRLQNVTTNFDSFANLHQPNGIEYTESEESLNVITLEDVQNVNSLSDFSRFNSILDSDETTIKFAPEVSKEDRKTFIKLLNKHSLTDLGDQQKETALRNSVVDRILKLLKHPRNQVALHVPISMDDLQALASKSKLGNKEKQITSDNPFTKFLMQVQNMVGKDVIGVTAVGLKVFFAASTYINQRIEDLAKAILNRNNDIIPEILGDICFRDPLDNTKIATLANVNFEPVFKALQTIGADYTVDIAGTNVKNLPEILRSQSSLRLYDIVFELQESADSIDAADSISQLLSSATDNAKELILAKINATIDFADT